MKLKFVLLMCAVAFANAKHQARKHSDLRAHNQASMLLDSSMVVSQPPPDVLSNDDRFHISRLERVRFGSRTRALTRPNTIAMLTSNDPSLASVPHSDECKYKKEMWEDCDPISNTQKRRLVLKKGNPTCDPTKEIVRSCKGKPGQATPKQTKNGAAMVCRYKKGTWSECDAHTGLKLRTDTIKMNKHSNQAQVNANCEPTRVMTKKCKATKLGCKYNRSAAWSECDTRTNLRTKVLKLEAGSAADCEADRRVTKTCRMSKGRKNQANHEDVMEDEDEDNK